VKIEIDPSSPVHPYQQLANQLRAMISSGEITNQLPSITDLTETTDLAVGTVRRGIDILVKEGLVKTVPGRGTFVVDKGPAQPEPPAKGGREGRSRPPAGRARSSDDPRPHGHIRH
jgi:DNA-binding GntR family transcriptional regulator